MAAALHRELGLNVYVVTVAFEIKPEFIAAFRAEMVANAQASAALEPGCRQFDVCVDPAAPGHIFLYELYDDKAAFDAHLASAHFIRFNEATAPWVMDKRVRLLERVS